jgi:hypothetical protein
LFRESVALYSRTLAEPMLKALAEGPTARASIEWLLQAVVGAFCKPGLPRGYMLVPVAINTCLRVRAYRIICGAFARAGRRRSPPWISALSRPSLRLRRMDWRFRRRTAPSAKTSSSPCVASARLGQSIESLPRSAADVEYFHLLAPLRDTGKWRDRCGACFRKAGA